MPRPIRILLLLLLPLLGGCAQIIGSQTRALAEGLDRAMQEHDDPRTVAEAMPAYLIMVDGLIARRPDDPATLLAGSRLYGAYAGNFVDDEPRAARLARRALGYARRAFCLELPDDCHALDEPLPRLAPRIEALPAGRIDLMYGLGTAWAGWIRANSGDWNAVADLPKARLLLQRVVALDACHDQGNAQLYLGVMDSLLPPSMGGRPEQAKRHFEQAIACSEGRNLMAKVLYARHYARLMFDRRLHDRLLNEVLAADPHQPGLTLANELAQAEARRLLASADEYF
ncbi:MAG TPA: hypothetical protein ENK00_00935 [Chromatiales bacterium]|nr:hypothetical protein [Chromatiales bacterium]